MKWSFSALFEHVGSKRVSLRGNTSHCPKHVSLIRLTLGQDWHCWPFSAGPAPLINCAENNTEVTKLSWLKGQGRGKK